MCVERCVEDASRFRANFSASWARRRGRATGLCSVLPTTAWRSRRSLAFVGKRTPASVMFITRGPSSSGLRSKAALTHSLPVSLGLGAGASTSTDNQSLASRGSDFPAGSTVGMRETRKFSSVIASAGSSRPMKSGREKGSRSREKAWPTHCGFGVKLSRT